MSTSKGNMSRPPMALPALKSSCRTSMAAEKKATLTAFFFCLNQRKVTALKAEAISLALDSSVFCTAAK